MIDLYLDPDFTVEGSDFVFKAHDDDKKDYIVCVTKDDFKAFTGLENECHVDFFGKKEGEHQNIHEACQQIVDRYQTGTTTYDVEIKRKKVECYEFKKKVKRTFEFATIKKTNFKGAADVQNFMRQHDFTSYKTILG